MRKQRKHDPGDPNDPEDTCTEVTHTEAQQSTAVQEPPDQQLPATIEVHDGLFKSLDMCSPTDFFNAHVLAKAKAADHMRTAQFLLAASEYYKTLSNVPQ
jgi:hypothetical protein